MTVRDTTLIARELIKDKLEPDQQAIVEILEEMGPTHDRRILEALNQKEQATLKPKRQKRKWEINSVTARRNDLLNMGLIIDLGSHKGTWHGDKKTYHIWRLGSDLREPIGWKPVTKQRKPLPTPEQRYESRQHLQEIREKAGAGILQRINASEAGRILRGCRKTGPQNEDAVKQLVLFSAG